MLFVRHEVLYTQTNHVNTLLNMTTIIHLSSTHVYRSFLGGVSRVITLLAFTRDLLLLSLLLLLPVLVSTHQSCDMHVGLVLSDSRNIFAHDPLGIL